MIDNSTDSIGLQFAWPTRSPRYSLVVLSM